MRILFLLASAAAMAVTVPAVAKPGQGGAKAHAGAKSSVRAGGVRTRSDTTVRSGGKARTDARSSTRAQTRTGASVNRTRDTDGDGIPDYRDTRTERTRTDRSLDTDRDGIPDYRDRLTDRNRDGVDDRAQNRYGGADCPPGLENRTPACIPPGQAARMFREGQRLPNDYRYYSELGDIPPDLRNQLPTGSRYIYRGDTVYVVDPVTRLVTRIINR